jgi:FKBP-type peptidyl-prolyl cis-trans isomerase FklB
MKKLVLALALAGSVSSAMAAVSLNTEEEKLSYSIGTDLGSNFKSQNINVNSEAFMAGMKDALSGKAPALTKAQMKETLQNFQKKMLMKRLAQYKKSAEKNKTEGESFLNKNKSKAGVVTLKSGLQYKVLAKGKGNSPKKEDSVTVEYTGKLLSGKVFDSSEKTGKPATFKVTQVIPGWTEALQLMKVGAKWEIYVPSKLAYGPRGIGGPIGPNETLVFQIKLISIEKKSKA